MRTEATEEGFRVERKVNGDTGAIGYLFYLHDKLVPHVPISGKIVQRLNGFGMIHKDLVTVLEWLREAEKLLATVESGGDARVTRIKDRKLGNKIKSLFVSSLVFYAKAFTEAPGRNATLKRETLDATFHDAHDDAMKYRHNVAAHSGLEKIEYGESCILLWPVGDDNFRLTVHTNRTQPDFAATGGDFNQFAALVEHVMAKAESLYEKTANKIGELALKQGAQFWMTAYGLSKTTDIDDLEKKFRPRLISA